MTGQPTPHSWFYSGRSGRPLRGARAAALEQGLPKFQITLDDLPGLLAGGQTLWLEIGFGSGEHLLAQATHHPDVTFIGCEPFYNGVSALLKGVAETGLTNLRVFTEDARFVLKALPDASLDRCFVLFADPWPKKRHNKRRIINQDTLTDLARVLTPSGEIYLATDDVPLAQWYEEVVAAHPAFIIQPASGPTAQDRPADWPVTRYEEKAVAKGLKPFYYRVGRLKKKP